MLFDHNGNEIREKEVSEKELQNFVETKILKKLGIQFLASEYIIKSDTHNGRLDTLGIDTNGNPVVIEYKQSRDRGVINQCIYYMNYLKKNKQEFEELVKVTIRKPVKVNWLSPRIICIAAEFSKHDQSVAEDCAYNVELIKYKTYDNMLGIEYFYKAPLDEKIKIETDTDDNISSYNNLVAFLKEVANFGIVYGNSPMYGSNFGKGYSVMKHRPSSTGGGQYGYKNKKEQAYVFGREVIAINIEGIVPVLNKHCHRNKYTSSELIFEVTQSFKKTIHNNGEGLVLAPYKYRIAYRDKGHHREAYYTLFDREKLVSLVPEFEEIKM